MTAYATREDVIRELGGTADMLKERLGERIWIAPMTSVTVDGLTFDVPDHILLRIDVRIKQASSRLNTKILTAYKGEPAAPYPAHLVEAAAKLAATQCCVTDGARPDYLREMSKHVDTYFDQIAKMELDLGIEGPRESHRAPAAYVGRGVGRRSRGTITSLIGGCE